MVTVSRSRSIDGPWEHDPANPVARTWSADEPWWSRGHATVVEGPTGDWWMLTHAYEHGYRTLGRQVLLEPVEWTEDGWLRAPTPDLAAPIRKPVDLPEQRHGGPLSDDFRGPTLGDQWAFHAPAHDEQGRVHLDGDGLVLAGKGASPSDASPLTVIAGDRAYEVSVSVELEGDAEGGLLLFFNSALFLGMGIDGTGMRTYSGGHASHWREPAPAARTLDLRIENDRHIVTFSYRQEGGDWVRHGVRFETSGYHANTAGDLLSLRPALFAAGNGSVRFRDFRYRALR
jgi:xylan 1,4-beta-xylosidase